MLNVLKVYKPNNIQFTQAKSVVSSKDHLSLKEVKMMIQPFGLAIKFKAVRIHIICKDEKE